jgi:hypothetical protein
MREKNSADITKKGKSKPISENVFGSFSFPISLSLLLAQGFVIYFCSAEFLLHLGS